MSSKIKEFWNKNRTDILDSVNHTKQRNKPKEKIEEKVRKGRVAIGILLLTGYLCVAIDWLNTISPTRVYVLNEDGKKLYLLYAFDKKTIMCKLENQKRVQEYVPISKQEIINSTIYVEHGNEVLEEVESPHQIEDSDNRKE